MSIDSTMAILYAQSGLAAPLVSSAANAPQVAAAMSRTLATELAKQEQQQIEKVEPKKEGSKINPEGQGARGGGDMMFGSRRRRRNQYLQPQTDEDDDSPRPSGSPLIGNLLNVKV